LRMSRGIRSGRYGRNPLRSRNSVASIGCRSFAAAASAGSRISAAAGARLSCWRGMRLRRIQCVPFRPGGRLLTGFCGRRIHLLPLPNHSCLSRTGSTVQTRHDSGFCQARQLNPWGGEVVRAQIRSALLAVNPRVSGMFSAAQNQLPCCSKPLRAPALSSMLFLRPRVEPFEEG